MPQARPLGKACKLPQQGGVPSQVRIALSRPDFASLEGKWRALEERAENSFFQSWTWVGCRAEARFPDPVLLRAEQDGRTVGLALCNRTCSWRGEKLFLGESGDAALDAVYVEHNGPLLARGAEALRPAILRALLPSWRGCLRLSGVDAAHLAAARQAGAIRLRAQNSAPWLDLSALRQGEDGFMNSLSANTRYQVRRSDRAYGPIRVDRAATLAEAENFLDALAVLHTATWRARGKPGAFDPTFTAFHRALLARAHPRGEAELLRIAAGAKVIGYLYNFRHRGRVLAYQSGFDYQAGPHQKPGLTCHHAAIALARREGAVAYDFLAGGDRYKTSFANASTELYWLDLAPRWSVRGMAYRIKEGFSADGADKKISSADDADS
jgi:CelD/BcsL family acetyltransferase involved in cellulose biosynthesis